MARYGATGVDEQRVIQGIGGREEVLRVTVVHGDSPSLCSEGGEFGAGVTEVTGLPGAARGHRGGIKEEHDGSISQGGGQLTGHSVVVNQGEIRGEVSGAHTVTLERGLYVVPC